MPEPPADEVPKSPATDPVAVERRLQRNIPFVSIVLVTIVWWKTGWQTATSVALGCSLSYLNYTWMHSSLKAILLVTEGKPSPGQMAKFLSRWIVIFGVAALAVKFFDLSVLAILLGLFAFPAAVLLEAVFQLFWAISHGVDG